VLEDNFFQIPSQPFSFCTLPDWIKTKKISRFLLVRTVHPYPPWQMTDSSPLARGRKRRKSGYIRESWLE
jgi:hypothetical protein